LQPPARHAWPHQPPIVAIGRAASSLGKARQ
jgi:hypothetical protein